MIGNQFKVNDPHLESFVRCDHCHSYYVKRMDHKCNDEDESNPFNKYLVYSFLSQNAMITNHFGQIIPSSFNHVDNAQLVKLILELDAQGIIAQLD